MSELEELVKVPNHDSEASEASKATIFMFIATFTGCLFFLENTASLLSGAIFVVTGIFLVSLLISAPLFFLMKRFAKSPIIFSLLNVIATIYITVMVFSYFFTNPLNFPPADVSDSAILECDEAIPKFTLGSETAPTSLQLSQLCGCIWRELSPWAREVSAAVAAEQEGDIPEIQLRAFMYHFSQNLTACNTEGL